MDKIGFDLLGQLETASSVAELGEIGKAFAKALGFQHFLYAVRIPKPPSDAIHYVISGNYPAAWRKLYDQREYVRIDPIVQHAFASALPIAWDEVPLRNQAITDFFAAAAQFGLVHGVSAPIYSRRGEIGLFSLSLETAVVADKAARMQLKQDIQVFATAFNEAALKLPLTEKKPTSDAPRLTPREREALLYVHGGNTTAQIASIMGISERTVLAFIDTAGQKLGVSGRHNVVSRAVSLGELELNRQALTAKSLPQTREYVARH